MFKELKLILVPYPDKKMSTGQYFDFIVSAQPLRQYLGLKDFSTVTPFGYFTYKEHERRVLKEYRLQYKTALPNNRIELYLCPACGELACGGITARIIDKGNKIIWTEFAEQSDEDEISRLLDAEEIEFDRSNYMRALNAVT